MTDDRSRISAPFAESAPNTPCLPADKPQVANSPQTSEVRGQDEALCEFPVLQEAVALGIAVACGSLERGTGLLPQPIFDRLYADGLLDLSFDHTGEAWVIVTDKGEQRYAEILGGDVGDI